MAAAASSWVERGLLAQRETSAPPALRARMRLAVSVVTCMHAPRRIPFSGFSFANRSRMARSTGMSRSAHSMRPRPASARRGFAMSDVFAMGASPFLGWLAAGLRLLLRNLRLRDLRLRGLRLRGPALGGLLLRGRPGDLPLELLDPARLLPGAAPAGEAEVA